MGNTTIPAELVAINAIQGTLIADNAITAVHIGQNQVHSVQLAINSVTATQIADGTITSAKIQDGAIATADIADVQITTAKLADNSVTSAKIVNASIVSADIANNAILTQHIDDNQITADQIADNAVGLGQLASLSRGSIIYGNSAGNPAYLAAGSSGHVLTSDGTDISWTADTDLFLASSGGTVTGDITLTSGTSNKPKLTITNTNADSTPPYLILKKDSASPADNDEVGRIYMYGDDDAGNATEAFLAIGKMTDVSNGSEDSSVDMYTYAAGAQTKTLTLKEGKVGVGTTSPQVKAHIDESSGATLMLTRTNANTSGDLGILRFGNTNWDSNLAEIVGVQDGANDSAKLQFKTQPSGAATATRMTILSGGNVGIGNTNPATNLHIGSGTEGENLGLKINRGSTTNFLVACDGTKQAYIGVDNSQGFMKMGSLSNHPVSISQNNGNAIYIDTAKSVGFNTTDPLRSFDVRQALSIFGTGGYTELMLRGIAGTAQNLGAFHLSLRSDVGGNNDDLKILRFTGGNSPSYAGIAMQIQNSTGNVGIGTSSPGTLLTLGDGTGSPYFTIDKSASGESGLLFKNAGNNKGKILLNSNENLKFYINNSTDAMTINEASSVSGDTTTPGVQIGNLSHGWGNLVVTSDDNNYDGGITIVAESTSGGADGYGALFWKQGGMDKDNTKWFLGFTNSTSGGAAHDDILLGAYNLNTGYSRGGRSDGVMHFDRSTGDVHVAKQVNFHGQEGFKVYNDSGFSKGTSWEDIGDSITTVDYNGGGWDSSNGRFTATKAGYYLFTFGGWAAPNSDGSRYASCFRKNTTGLRYISGGDYCSVDSPLNGHSEVIYMNGSSDYVELYAYSSISTTWGGSSHSVWWGAEFLH